jgi:hypothetical protein
LAVDHGDTEVLEIRALNGDTANYQNGSLGLEVDLVAVVIFNIYANPVNNSLIINTVDTTDTISTYSIRGQKTPARDSKKINTSRFTKGVSFMKVRSNGQNSVQKFIKS